MIVVTAATGHLGRLVIESLLQTQPASTLVAAVRNPESAQDLADRGVTVRHADYTDPASLRSAFAGADADALLLISSNDLQNRMAQHTNAIDAARDSRVGLLAYTSILHCPTTPISLATDHRATEDLIRASGLPFSFLRNGWYFENYTASLPASLQHGALISCAGDAPIAAASRADYAAAAAAVLAAPAEHRNSAYELAGDTPFTFPQLAAELSRQSGREVAFHNLSEAAYRDALAGFGLPAAIAAAVAQADAVAADGALDDRSHTLSRLAGRPTTTLEQAVRAALPA